MTGLRVVILNSAVLQAYHDATLNLENIPLRFSKNAKAASVMSAPANKYLLSPGLLCKNGCDYILLDKNMLAFSSTGSQPSSEQEILPTEFDLST